MAGWAPPEASETETESSWQPPEAVESAPPNDGPKTAADLMSGRFTEEQRRAAMKSGQIRIPTMADTGLVPKEVIEPVLKYATPVGLTELATEAIAPGNTPGKVVRGVTGGLSEVISGLTTPESISQLAIAPASKAGQLYVALGFGAKAATDVPGQVEQFRATDDPAEKARIATEAVAGLGFPLMAGAHAMVRRPASLTGKLFGEVERPEAKGESAAIPAEEVRPEARAQEWVPPEVAENVESAPAPISELLRQDIMRNPSGEFSEEVSLAKAAEPPPAAGDTPAATVAGAEAKPRLLPGEEQGDLISSTQPEDLTLAGEKGVDFEARQKETDAAAAAKEEARLKAEHEQGLLSDFEEQRARGGDELLDAVESGGGLPALSSERADVLSGELKNIREEIVSETGKQKYGFDYNRVFKKDAPDLDALTQHLRQKGFDVETPNDTLSLIQDRLRSGKKMFGDEARMTTLEEAGFGPGAASAKEPLASYEQRRFGKRLQADEGVAPEIREQTGNQYYEPIPNKVTVSEAEKIIEDYGTDTSIRLVRDESAPMEPRVRATMGQGLVKKLNQSFAEAKAAGDTVRAKEFLDQAVDTAEYLSELGTRLGQGVQSFAIWNRLTPEGTLVAVRRAVTKATERIKSKNPDVDPKHLPNLTPEAEAKILELSEKVQAAPEGLPQDRASLELNKYIAKLKGFDPSDLPIGVYYGNILSGYNTHIVNSLDTFMNVLSEVNGLAMTNPRAAASVYGGMIRGLGEGKLDALLALTEGRMVTDGKWMDAPRLMEAAEFGKKGGVPIKEATRTGRVMKRLAESKPATVLNAYKYVTRLLAASDAVMFRSAKEARAALLAHRMAEAEGLKGDALLGRQREILGNPQMNDFRAQAEREGFKGVDREVRATELRDMTRPEELSSDSADFAGEATYNHEPHGALGFVAKQIGTLSEKYPAMKLFVPFTRIVANVTNRGLNYTPLGFARGRAKSNYLGEAATPEARRLMLARATVGTAGLVTLGAMQAGGLLQIHGAGPTDKERRRQLQAAGWKPYSLQIGDTYVSYVYTPIGLGLSILGNMSDAERHGELDQKDAATRAAYAVSRIPSTVFSQSFLSGLSRLFSALSSNPGEAVTALKQTASSTAGAVTTPNLVRDVQRIFDPKAYRSDSFTEDLIKNTPFASVALKPELNAFGEPVTLQSQRFVSKLTPDPVWRTVLDLKLRVPVPNKSTEIVKGKQVTPEQYYKLLQVTGPKIKLWIRRSEGRLRAMTPEAAQDELSEESAKIRKQALSRLR